MAITMERGQEGPGVRETRMVTKSTLRLLKSPLIHYSPVSWSPCPPVPSYFRAFAVTVYSAWNTLPPDVQVAPLSPLPGLLPRSCLFFFFFSSFFFLIVIQLQLYAFSPHPSFISVPELIFITLSLLIWLLWT